MRLRIAKKESAGGMAALAIRIGAIVTALVLSGLIMWAMGYNAPAAFAAIAKGSFGSGYGLANTMKDAYLPGYSNILRGEQMKIAMNDTGDVNQIVQLSKAVDPLSLGFGGYTDSNGAVATRGASPWFASTMHTAAPASCIAARTASSRQLR